MTSKDGLGDEGDYWWSLSLSRMHTFFRQVNILICLLLHRLMHMAMSRIHMFLSVDSGRPLSSRGSSEEQGVSKIYVLSEQPMPPLLLILWLDSGATHHAVGDARILCNLRDPPAGTAVRAADGVRLLVHKIGDILTQCIKIQDVYLVLGLQENLISVRQLAKDKKIVTIFYENYAELWREGKMVGGAIADNVTSLYQLRYLTMPTGDPEAGTSRYIREEAMDVATAREATNRSSFLQLLSLSNSTSTETKMIHACIHVLNNCYKSEDGLRVQNMFSAAAADSTYTRRLVWAMAELINHPHEMRRVQAEIRAAVAAAGNDDDDVTEDDLELLPYNKQVIKEMLRLCTPVPLLLPRETMEDTEHLGYHVPARTHIFFNAWAISRGPTVWRSADEFMPERFADDDMKKTTTEYLLWQDFDEFVPFGASWRRGCSGVGFAAPAMELELALASLLYHFGWELPAGRPPAAPKDELSVRLKTTLHLVAKPWSSQ